MNNESENYIHMMKSKSGNFYIWGGSEFFTGACFRSMRL